MEKYLIDNVDIFAANGIRVLKAKGVFDAAPLRISKQFWNDKSGSDVDFGNIRYQEGEYSLECICIATTKQLLVNQMDAFNEVFKNKGLMVFSIRGAYRKAFLVYKEAIITGVYNRATGNKYAYLFTLKLVDANPAATRWITKTNIRNFIIYDGVTPAMAYWGDGSKTLLDAAETYNHTYSTVTDIDIIIDLDGATVTEIYPTIEILDAAQRYNMAFYPEKPFTFNFKIDFVCRPNIDYADLNFRIDGLGVLYTSHIVGFHENPIIFEDSVTVNLNESMLSYFAALNHVIGESVDYFELGALWLHVLSAPNAGIKRFQIKRYLSIKESLDLSGNALIQNDVDALFDIFKWRLDNNLDMADNVNINISGGTNAKPNPVFASTINYLRTTYNWTILHN